MRVTFEFLFNDVIAAIKFELLKQSHPHSIVRFEGRMESLVDVGKCNL